MRPIFVGAIAIVVLVLLPLAGGSAAATHDTTVRPEDFADPPGTGLNPPNFYDHDKVKVDALVDSLTVTVDLRPAEITNLDKYLAADPVAESVGSFPTLLQVPTDGTNAIPEGESGWTMTATGFNRTATASTASFTMNLSVETGPGHVHVHGGITRDDGMAPSSRSGSTAGSWDAHPSSGKRHERTAARSTDEGGSGPGRAGGLPGTIGTSPRIPVALVVGAAVGVVAWIAYRRLSRDEILDHDVRSRLLELVEDDPGISPSELVDTIEVSLPTILYHVRVLEETGLLEVDRRGRAACLFVAGAATKLRRRTLAALRRDGRGDLLRLVVREPEVGLSEAARRLDRAPSTIKRHADTLIEEGILQDVGDGRLRCFTCPSQVQQIVAEQGAAASKRA